MMAALDRRPGRNTDILFRRVEDEAVLVDQDEAVVWRLNETGAVIWDAMDGRRTAGDIARRLCEVFDIDEPAARRDTLEFLSALAAKDLLSEGP
ncbi:MAG: PqqD family protein [Elusimicrobia bacterium]|nr:PqqD family protein [Elusimicrobiota bacterium]